MEGNARGERGGRRITPLVRRDLPTGTVTFVLTDIEGSTRLLRDIGEGPYAALAVLAGTIREYAEERDDGCANEVKR